MEPTKRILDEETRKALIGFSPFSVQARHLFTPVEFKNVPETARPIFVIRPLTQGEINQLKHNSSSYSVSSTQQEIDKISELNKELIRACVIDWSNLYDSGNGEEILFTNDKIIFNSFPQWLLSAITNEVRKISGLSSIEDLGLK